jgi:peptide/nickel transport system ATP-binding protein
LAQLRLDTVGVSFGGAAALAGVSFSLGKGQRLGIIGEAGAGKTLLALAIIGLLPTGATATGTVTFDEQALSQDQAALAAMRGKRIGMIFQDGAGALDPLQTAREHLSEALTLAGVTDDLDKETDGLLAQVGLPLARAALFPAELEAGERQCLMVAMAIAGKPELLIADDPAASLDLIAERRILDLIDRLCTERGMSLLLISPDLKAVAMLCTRVVVLHQGRVVEAGDKAEVFGHPKHDFTRGVLTGRRYRARALMRSPIGGTLLDVRGIDKRYRHPDASFFERRPPIVALDNVSFTMRIGESMALVGPAGAGKTTLGRIIAGLERVSKGELEFDARVYHGTDLVPVNRGDISMVFRDPSVSFNPRLTLGESISEPLRLEQQRLMDELSARIVEVVTAVGLSPDMLGRYPGELSLTEQQRFAIARALITRPRLVVLDEPVAALDVGSRGEMLVLLDRLRADFGLTLLVTGRDLDTIRVIVDRVLILDKGRIVETGTPAQLLEKPEQNVTKRLVAAALPDVGIVPVF